MQSPKDKSFSRCLADNGFFDLQGRWMCTGGSSLSVLDVRNEGIHQSVDLPALKPPGYCGIYENDRKDYYSSWLLFESRLIILEVRLKQDLKQISEFYRLSTGYFYSNSDTSTMLL